MAIHYLQTPLDKATLRTLRSGDKVFLSGIIYSARDTAHKRFMEYMDAGKDLPFPLAGAVIYYMGPSPTPKGFPIGSAGPTTSCRMDAYTPRLYSRWLAATIGKGKRSSTVIAAMQFYGAVYFGATGGAGALIAKCITAAKVIAFEDLGAEAVRELTVCNFPLLVINDCFGGELYATPKVTI